MFKDSFDSYKRDPDDNSHSHYSGRRLPSLHEVLGDVLDQASMSGSSYRPSREGRRSYSTDAGRDMLGSNLPQNSILTPRSRSHPSTSSSSGHMYTATGTSQSQLPGPSYHLFNYSPNEGLVHQRSSARDDLDPSTPKPRLPPSDPARKYVCAECGNRFSKQSTLRNHLLTHSGERPFACTYPGCGRRFSMACNMQRHMRTHTSASAFQYEPADDGDRDTRSPSRGRSSRDGSPRDDLWSNNNSSQHFMRF